MIWVKNGKVVYANEYKRGEYNGVEFRRNKERVLDIWRDAVDEAGKGAGFMLLSKGHFEALFIDSAYYRQGVGRVLVDEALKRYPSLTVDVNEQNIEAMGFYTHLGFERFGRSEKDGQGRDYPLVY